MSDILLDDHRCPDCDGNCACPDCRVYSWGEPDPFKYTPPEGPCETCDGGRKCPHCKGTGVDPAVVDILKLERGSK